MKLSSISVNCKGIDSVLDLYSLNRRDLSSNIASLRSIKSYSSMSGYGFSSIYKSLDRVIMDLDDKKSCLKNLENGLSDILKKYKECENNVSEHIKASEVKSVEVEYKSSWTLGNTLEVISEAGIIGNVVSAIGSLITGDWTAENIISTLKTSVLPAIGNISATVSKGSNANWRDTLLGLGNGLAGLDTSSAGKTFTSSLNKQFGQDLSLTGAKSVGDKIKVGTKWGGYALSLVSNFLENKEEFEGTGETGRMIAEIGIETVVDIGVGAAATAAVSAGAAALVSAGLITFAPAVAIGAGAVAVAWAANSVCEWITGGKDIGEVAADFVCDVAEAVGEIKDGLGAFAKWTKSLFNFG